MADACKEGCNADENGKTGGGFILTVLGAIPSSAAELGKGETEHMTEEAFIYGFPMVMNYAVFYGYFVDKASPEYKGSTEPALQHGARLHAERHGRRHAEQRHAVFVRRHGPARGTVRRLQPREGTLLLVQLVDMYTFNYGCMGGRTTGNGALRVT